MKPKVLFLLLFTLFFSSIVLHSVEIPLFSDFKWEKGFSTSPDGRGWQHQGVLRYTYSYSVSKIKNHLTCRGFQEKQCIEQKREGKKNMLALWVKGERQVMVMLTQVETDMVFVSWGEVPNG